MITATATIPARPAFVAPVRHCDICGAEASITINRDHFCGDCMKSRRVRAFLLGKASR